MCTFVFLQTALIRSTLLGIQQMRRDSGGKGGVVLNVSSIAGLCALPKFPVYSTTKHAVVNFSRSFAVCICSFNLHFAPSFFSSFTMYAHFFSYLATLSLSENKGENHSTLSRPDRGKSRRFSKQSYGSSKVPTPKVCISLCDFDDFSQFLDDRLFFTIRVQSVAHGLIYAIRCAQNGSIWISEQGKPVYEVQLSDSLPQKTDQPEEQQS